MKISNCLVVFACRTKSGLKLGKRHCFDSMVDFLEECVPPYKSFLKNNELIEERKQVGNIIDRASQKEVVLHKKELLSSRQEGGLEKVRAIRWTGSPKNKKPFLEDNEVIEERKKSET